MGVWLSNHVLDIGQGAKGDAILTVKIPLRDIKEYELVTDGSTYREWCVPSWLVNQYHPKLLPERTWNYYEDNL